MTIPVELDAETFRRFTIFDQLKRRRAWRGPVIFALILGISAAVCFLRFQTRGAILLGSVLLFVGLGLPCLYFCSFFASMKRQIRQQGLSRPQQVYTVTLSDKAEGIQADNEREKLTYAWKKAHHAYRDLTAIYLYLTPQRALILPHACTEEPNDVWNLICKRMPKEKTTIL